MTHDPKPVAAPPHAARTAGMERDLDELKTWLGEGAGSLAGTEDLDLRSTYFSPPVKMMLAQARESARQALAESERRYRLLAENSSDIIWTTDADLRITYSSPSAVRLLGFSLEEVTARSVERYLTPRSLALVRGAFREVHEREARRPGSTKGRTVEIEVVRSNGSTVWMEVSLCPLRDGEGRLAGFQGSCRDVTDRKSVVDRLVAARAELAVRVEQRTAELRESNRLLIQEIRERKQAQKKLQESESRYRGLVENARCVIMELDTRGRVSFLNRFGQEFYGFAEAEVRGRRAVGTIMPGTDSAGKDMGAMVRAILRDAEGPFTLEAEGLRRDGGRVWVRWTTRAICDEDGRLRRVLFIGMDTTEQRRMAEMLGEQVKEKAAAEERQRLARDLHDAVTQNLFAASLIAEVLPRLWKKDRRETERRLAELGRLTRGALAEMRLLLLELRPVSLGEVGLPELLRRLVEVMSTDGSLKVVLRSRGKCSLPPEVQVALYRVAQEAMNNVVKHSGASRVEIRLGFRRGSAELVVADNGSGFDLGRVPARSLGISIMRERMEAIGAALMFEAQAGRGTTVRAVWPMAAGRAVLVRPAGDQDAPGARLPVL